MKRILFTLILSLFSFAAFAQPKGAINGTIVAKIINEEQQQVTEGLVGATIELMSKKDTLQKRYELSAIRGAFQFKQVNVGDYQLKVELLGYKTTTKDITIKRGETLEIKDWLIEEDMQQIAGVDVKTQAVRTTINGDTIVYNAGAYKVLPDANADELLAKMPGIKVEGGSVEAQGEAVQKILIDGREFFGNDVASAIATLPAEAIKSVEVFDKLSDEAEFSGIDDGNSYKAINFVTKIKTAVYGRVNAMYAVEPKENDLEKTQHFGSGDGYANIFNKKAKTTVRFSANNMNGNSESKMGYGGLNYINSWGEDDKVKLEGSYSFNANNNKNYSWSERDYFLTEEQINSNRNDIYDRQKSNNYSNSKGNSHGLNARFEWKINPRHRLMLRANASLNGNKNNGNNYTDYFPVSSMDSIRLDNWNFGDSDGFNVGFGGNYMVRIGEKAGRIMYVNFNGNYSDNGSNSENYSERSVDESIQQYSNSNNGSYSLSGSLTYAEPIGEHAQITAEYRINNNYRDADRMTYLYDFDANEYLPDMDPDYSNKYNTEYLTQNVGPGFRYGYEGTSVSARVNYQHVAMSSDRVYPQAYSLPRKTFENITYSANARIKINQENRISARVSSSTSNPSVNDLQDVVDISNVNNIRSGNPDLKPSYSHRGNIDYTHSGIMNGTTFSIGFNGSKTQNNIVNSVIMNSPGYEVYSPDGEFLTALSPTGRFTKPINVKEGSWNFGGRISYGFPVNFIGCNMNIDANGSISQSPSMLNEVINRSKNRSLGGSVMLSSNFSDYVDFRLRYSPRYSNVENSMSASGNNEYINHHASGNVRVVFGFGLTLHANVNYSKYKGLSETASRLDNEDFIANAGLGMKVLKKLGEIQLVANDIFNRNSGFGRSWNALYMENSMRSVIGRYFGIKFTYNIRSRNATSAQQQEDRGGFRPGMQMGPGGPGGGFGGGRGGYGGGGFGGGYGGGGGRF